MDELIAKVSFFSPPLVTTIFLLVTILILVTKRSKPAATLPLPPGPRKLPIIGNLHQLAVSNLPHRRLRELAREYGPLMLLQLGGTPTVVVSSSELAKQFLQTHDLNFATRPFLPSASIIFYNGRDIVFGPFGDYWRQMRKIFVVELLSPKRVKSFGPIRLEEAQQLVKSIDGFISSHKQEAINLSRIIITRAIAIASRMAVGKSPEQEEAFLPVLLRIMKAIGGFNLVDLYPSSKLVRLIGWRGISKLKKLHGEADVILQQVITDHIAAARKATDDNVDVDDDLVHVLLNLTSKNLGFPITHVDIKAVILDVFLGASDTTATTLEWAISELMKHPRVMKKTQKEVRQMFDGKETIDEDCVDELQYLKLVIKETLRLHPPGPLLTPRESQESVVINRCHIPAKTRVTINAWAIGRDPYHWEDPESFYPERFIPTSVDYNGLDLKLIPFGAGRRMCPGIQSGMAVVSLLLANLLYYFDWKLPNGIDPQDFDMEEEFGISVKRKNNLFLIPIPRHPPNLFG